MIANCYDADAQNVVITAPMDMFLAEKKGGKWMALGARAFVALPAPTPAK